MGIWKGTVTRKRDPVPAPQATESEFMVILSNMASLRPVWDRVAVTLLGGVKIVTCVLCVDLLGAHSAQDVSMVSRASVYRIICGLGPRKALGDKNPLNVRRERGKDEGRKHLGLCLKFYYHMAYMRRSQDTFVESVSPLTFSCDFQESNWGFEAWKASTLTC